MSNDFIVTVNGLQGTPSPETTLPQVQWTIATGTATAITAAYATPNTALVDGLILGFRAAQASPAGPVTFSPDGLTAATITCRGRGVYLGNDIPAAGYECLVRYYSSGSGGWELLNPAQLWEYDKLLASDDTGGLNSTSAQPWFPTAGGLTLPVGLYYVEGLLYTTRSAGTTSHTTSLLLGGTATVSFTGFVDANSGADTVSEASDAVTWMSSAGATVVKAASTSASENVLVHLKGVLRVTAAGTVIPQFQYSAAPGGTPTVKTGTYIKVMPAGASNHVSTGAWA